MSVPVLWKVNLSPIYARKSVERLFAKCRLLMANFPGRYRSLSQITLSDMEAKIDDYGRIVIPKEVRDKLGIESGTSLEIRVDGKEEGAITLRPKGQKPALQQKGELLVHSGKLTEADFDMVDQLRTERRQRARKHAGLDR